jgi:hypothetical protein
MGWSRWEKASEIGSVTIAAQIWRDSKVVSNFQVNRQSDEETMPS